MVERQLVDEVRIGSQVLAEPREARIAERLDVAERLRDAPGRGAAAARLLRNRERDALIERAREKGHLAGEGTARDGESLEVDVEILGRELEPVDEIGKAHV